MLHVRSEQGQLSYCWGTWPQPSRFREVWGASGPAEHPSMLLGQPGMLLHHSGSTASSPRAGPTGPAGSRLAVGLPALPMLSRGGARGRLPEALPVYGRL